MSNVCYLIHFEKPYKHARHYIGTTKDLAKRIAEHGTANGARLLQVVAGEGIGFDVVRTWPGGYELEIELKKRKNAGQLCPRCNPKLQEQV